MTPHEGFLIVYLAALRLAALLYASLLKGRDTCTQQDVHNSAVHLTARRTNVKNRRASYLRVLKSLQSAE